MKKILLFTLLFLVTAGITIAQNTWTQKADVGGVKRQSACGFAIAGKGYIGLGLNYESLGLEQDFWSYDPTTNAWTQVANYGGTARYNPAYFVIGTVAYVGLGSDNYPSYHFRNDFWKYDQTANTWSQISSFPGTARYSGSGFSIGTKGYAGFGYNSAQYFNDFYEYNPTTDIWTQKATYPGVPRSSGAGFSINGYGYYGAGLDGGSGFSDFYKYDPAVDSWTAIASLPSIVFGPSSFVIYNKGYVGTGSTAYPNIGLQNHFWRYDPASNTWAAIADMGGTLRVSTVGFAIGNAGYCGTGGYNDFTQDLTDFWKYAPASGEGTNDLSVNDFHYSIFPNISNSKFSIEYSSAKSESMEIKIININGKIIQSESKYFVEGMNHFDLDLSNAAKGIYFVELVNANEKAIQKIVLQ